MKEAIPRIDDNASQFIENSRNYLELLRQHIDKEDNILYKVAERHISKRGKDEMLEEFERVERALARKYVEHPPEKQG